MRRRKGPRGPVGGQRDRGRVGDGELVEAERGGWEAVMSIIMGPKVNLVSAIHCLVIYRIRFPRRQLTWRQDYYRHYRGLRPCLASYFLCPPTRFPHNNKIICEWMFGQYRL